MQVRRRIHVAGIVQGVGFRPYVYRLATERHLAGQIANTSAGVVIEVEGAAEAVDDFLSSLPRPGAPAGAGHVSGWWKFTALRRAISAFFRVMHPRRLGRSFLPTSQRARIACANYSISPTAAITILSSIVRTAARDSPLCGGFHTIVG